MKTPTQIQEFNKIAEYNGYTNKPTWAVSLWINNDEELQSQVLELARHGKDVYNVADLLKTLFTDKYYPLDEASVYMDLLNWALVYVDWDELAEHFINDAKEIQ